MPFALRALAHWKLFVIGGLALALGVQSWRVTSLQGDVAAEKARHAAQVANYRLAAEKARADALAAKAATEGARASITQEVTDDYSQRLGAFLRASRVSSPKADSGSAGQVNLPDISIDASVFDGEGTDTRISAEDARLCGENTLRLMAAHEWAVKQVAVK